MRAARPLLAIAAVCGLAGCATQPLRTVEVGGLRNVAVLWYRYGEGAEHAVLSGPVGAIVRGPAPLRETGAAFASVGATQADREASRDVALVRSRPAHAVPRASRVAARHDTASAQADRAVALARAGTRARERRSLLAGAESQARSRALVSAAAMRVHDHAGQQHHRARRGTARIDLAAATIRLAERRPTLAKSADRAVVVAGERLEFTLEVANDSGLPLQSARITDALDPWLELEPRRVYAEGGVPLVVTYEGREVCIVLKRPVGRGERIRVHLPTVVRPTPGP